MVGPKSDFTLQLILFLLSRKKRLEKSRKLMAS